jgi:hypothetical protein
MKLFLPVVLVSAALVAAERPVRLSIAPENPLLFGKGSRQKLVAVAHFKDGSTQDVTAHAQLVSERPSVAALDGFALVAEANGASTVRAKYNGVEASTTALIQRAGAPVAPSFTGDILPVLTKLGCNGGSCHGALKGQAGFKLSLFGYEPENDFPMLEKRINAQEPEKSLLLLKPTFEVRHGGGKRMRKGSPEYNTLLGWIAGGGKGSPGHERRMTALRLVPGATVLFGKGAERRLLVTARFNDGTEADVTHLVQFSSNDDTVAPVTADGVVKAERGGETAIVVRGPGLAAAAKVGVVIEQIPVPALTAANFIDEHINRKLRELHVPPSAPADVATFLRRAYLDIIGLVPTAEEARAFLADHRPNRRALLVDSLLKRPEYADHWALYWGDHLSNTKQMLYNKGPYQFTRWLHDEFLKNTPYDQFVRKLMVSSGNMYDAPAANFYPLMKNALDMASSTSQLFLGVSIECARCHNHPLEKWTQDDFSGMAAFFSQVRYKNGTGPRNNERNLYVDFKRQFQHPDTKKSYLPKPLDGPYMETIDEWTDRRELLVNWMTSSGNPFFSRAIVNRMWRNFMGRGLVEPVDDFRATNPPTNPPLLDALAADFAAHGYDLHHLIRTITASNAYQRSSEPLPGNKDDKVLYSRFYPRRLLAEQLADSISQATGVEEKYTSQYPGARASQLPEPEIESYFLEVFDRPSRQLVCERKSTPTLNQALHLVSGATLHGKITDERSRLKTLLASGGTPEMVAEELYLSTVSRPPDTDEKRFASEAISRAGDARKGLEDVFWALLNSKEFLYNH